MTRTGKTPLPGPRPSGPSLWRQRMAARLAGWGPQIEGLRWQPTPRFAGSDIRGRQLLAGNLRIGGTLAILDKATPWDITSPTLAFEDALHGFEWLDDLAELPHAEGQQTARSWLRVWLNRYGRGDGKGWQPDLVGRRQIRWITHAPMVVDGDDPKSNRAFLRTLSRQAGYLDSMWRHAPPGLARLEALTGLIYSACTLMGLETKLDPALVGLAQECAQEITPTGGISTRNPEELLEVFVHLTWIRQILSETGKHPDPAVDTAIARIAPTLRALRHTDGALVRAHGGGRGAPGRLMAALTQSGVRPSTAKGLAMGFAHIEQGRVSLIVDAAPPMRGPGSVFAHAGTLSFELTSGNHPLVVNAGSGAGFGPKWHRAGRATVSHSTLALDGFSSSRWATRAGEYLAEQQGFDEGPSDVAVQFSEVAGGEGISLSHDGWRKSHGLIHLRSITLEDHGALLRGEDGIAAMDARDRARFDQLRRTLPKDVYTRFAVRFHLHPAVLAEMDMGGNAVSLTLPNEETWVFRHGGTAKLALRPSVYFDATRLRPRATKQIMLISDVRGYGTALSWTLSRPSALLPTPRK